MSMVPKIFFIIEYIIRALLFLLLSTIRDNDGSVLWFTHLPFWILVQLFPLEHHVFWQQRSDFWFKYCLGFLCVTKHVSDKNKKNVALSYLYHVTKCFSSSSVTTGVLQNESFWLSKWPISMTVYELANHDDKLKTRSIQT